MNQRGVDLTAFGRLAGLRHVLVVASGRFAIVSGGHLALDTFAKLLSGAGHVVELAHDFAHAFHVGFVGHEG